MTAARGGRQASEPTAVRNRLFAALYPAVSRRYDRRGGFEWRRRLAAGAAGRVLELGSGHGPMFAHYPARVREVVAVEPEPHLRARAERAAGDAGVPVTVVDAVAADLPFPDASFHTAVLSLVLCSVPDPQEALAEVRRVLRPDGQVRFLEHVRTRTSGWAGLQRAVDIVWPHLAGGCHLTRDAVAEIRAAGFGVTELAHLRLRARPPVAPLAPHVLGVAIQPGA